MSKDDRKLIVQMEFSMNDVATILEPVNKYCIDVEGGALPITVDEVMNTPKLKAFVIQELQSCTEEIVDGSSSAVANDWLDEISDYR